MSGFRPSSPEGEKALRAAMCDGLASWFPASGNSYLGTDRTGLSRFDQPPAPPPSLWCRLRSAWAGMVRGWREA